MKNKNRNKPNNTDYNSQGGGSSDNHKNKNKIKQCNRNNRKLLRELENMILSEINSHIQNMGRSGIRSLINPDQDEHISILDVYDSLLNMTNGLNTILKDFKDELSKSHSSEEVNTAIVHFTEQFYKIQHILKINSAIYQTIHFDSAANVNVAKKYVNKCIFDSSVANVPDCLNSIIDQHNKLS